MTQVLVIDDDPALRQLVQRSLTQQGYDVVAVDNGADGIQQAKAMRPAVILCDWMMPEVDGLEVCRQVKADANLAMTFFMLLTARADSQDRVQGFDSGADDFLAKPINLEELQARIRAAMRIYRLNQDLLEQKQRLEAELSEAADYVRSLLPDPMQDPIQIESRFLPSLQLGGDCFDYYWLDPDYLQIFLLDISGHGLGAALPSVTILNSLRSQILPEVNFYRPEKVLAALNETFQMTEQNNKYFTIWYGVYNRQKRLLTYASAGHPPAVLVSCDADDGQNVQQLATPNPPVGLFDDLQFTCDRCVVPQESQLYVFSDGIYECMTSQSKHGWDLDQLIALLSRQPTQSLDSILQHVKNHNGIDTFDDDLSLLRCYFG
jgi:sigma-B regulation protein RsbU (phosphoserine phosphatase)